MHLGSENEHIASEVSASMAALQGAFSGFLLGKSILVEVSGRLVRHGHAECLVCIFEECWLHFGRLCWTHQER